MLSLLEVRGYRIVKHRPDGINSEEAIDREDLVLPDLLVEDTSAVQWATLRPMFDVMWQAGGWKRSPR